MSLCPICGRACCDHTSEERNQTPEEVAAELTPEEIKAFDSNDDDLKRGAAITNRAKQHGKSPQTEKDIEQITGVHHIGIGLQSVDDVTALKDALVARGVEVVKEDQKLHKYFLRLNPQDTTLFEIFYDRDDICSMHVDFTVKDLKGVITEHPNLYDYGIPGMRFIDVPYMRYKDIYPLSIQLAFAERREK